MYRIASVIIIIIQTFANSFAQEYNTQLILDSSYTNYLNYRHEAQIAFLNNAIAKGYSFPELYNRLGIAYFNLGNYSLAENSYFQSLKLNSKDTTCIQLLRLSSIYSGNEDLYYYLKDQEPVLDSEKIKTGLVGFYGEYGEKISSNNSLVGNLSYYQLGLNHRIGKRFNLFQSFSNLSQNVNWGNINQYWYYVNSSIQMNRTAAIGFAATYIYADVTLNANKSSPVSSIDYTAEINLKYNYRKWGMKPQLGYLQVNEDKRWNIGSSIMYKFFGNDKLMSDLHVSYFTSANQSPTFLWNPGLLIRLRKNIWLKSDYLYANATNFSLGNQYFIFNSNDITKDRWSFLTEIKLNELLELYLIYQQENKIENESKTSYSFNTFVAGLKIKIFE